MLALLLTVTGLFGGCERSPSTGGPASANQPALDWRPCRLPRIAQALRCTTVDVAEVPGASQPVTLGLHVAVAGALRPEKDKEPLYFIAGGPGQGASRVAFNVLPALTRIRRDRDIVFVDVRGTGRSGPLECDLTSADDDFDQIFAADWPLERVRKCRRQHQGRHLAAYRTATIVADLEAVAARLGHSQVNVYGISYGTRVALQWMGSHPTRIRAAILDGVAPPQMTLFASFAEDAQATLDKLAADCRADGVCSEHFGDVRLTLTKLLQQFSIAPRTVHMQHPRTGELASVPVTRAGLAMAVRSLLYSADLQSLLPLALADAATGDFASLAAQTLTLTGSAEDTTSFGLLLEIACAEDVPRLSATDGQRGASTFLAEVLVEQMKEACRAWGAAEVDVPPQRAPVTSDVPTLLLSGALDPVTPPRWGAIAAKTLTKSAHVTVANAAHGSFSVGCVPQLMAEFIGNGSGDGIDFSCAREGKRPPFFLRRTGPAP